MVINTSREISTEKPFQRVRIQNPNVLSVIPLEGGNRLQISALQAGITTLDLMAGDDSVHTVEFMVIVTRVNWMPSCENSSLDRISTLRQSNKVASFLEL